MNSRIIRIFARLALILALAALHFKAASAAGTVRYARPGGLVSGTCTSWAKACELSYALGTAAASGDQIWARKGTYKPHASDRATSFLLKDGVAVYGGFAGTETELIQRNITTNLTILSGNINLSVEKGDNSYAVVRSSANNSTAILDGFKITGGYADGPGDSINGGGISVINGSTAVFRNLTITVNDAVSGAGMYIHSSNPKLANIKFINNYADSMGGGLFITTNSNPTLTKVLIKNNHALYGGGIYSYASVPVLKTVKFINNESFLDGGGMYNDLDSDAVLTNVLFDDNHTPIDNGKGGGMFNAGAMPVLNKVTFKNNSAFFYGGGMYNQGAGTSPALTNVTFTGNKASYYGGGMANYQSGSFTMSNVVFNANESGKLGGGVYNYISSPQLSSVKFILNTAAEAGGGMFNAGSDPVVTEALFSQNSAPSGGGMKNAGTSTASFTNVTFSLNQADSGGAVYNDMSSLTFESVLFKSNNATNGGAMYNISSSPTLTAATFSGNQATGFGGAMSNSTSNPVITNATFHGNTSGQYGGGNFSSGASSPVLNHVTFFGNDGSAGDSMANSGGANAQIRNSILWGEFPDQMYNQSSTPTITDSIVKGGCPIGASCSDVQNTDPLLGLLKNNGGYVPTMSLGVLSPAINAGDDAVCSPILADARGADRASGAGCDLGAYEVKTMVFKTQAAADGWVLEQSQGDNKGGSRDSTGTTLAIGDDSTNKRSRAILSFSTAALPDNSTAVLAMLIVTQDSLSGDPFGTQGNLKVDLAKPIFGNSSALENLDWQAQATTASVAQFTTVADGMGFHYAWFTNGFPGINKTGLTQFRLRFDGPSNGNNSADTLFIMSGNEAITDFQPELVVYYNP